jgi:hypothetical protein
MCHGECQALSILPTLTTMFINETKDQQTQPSSFAQTLQQACTAIDVSVVLVIVEINQ